MYGKRVTQAMMINKLQQEGLSNRILNLWEANATITTMANCKGCLGFYNGSPRKVTFEVKWVSKLTFMVGS